MYMEQWLPRGFGWPVSWRWTWSSRPSRTADPPWPSCGPLAWRRN